MCAGVVTRKSALLPFKHQGSDVIGHQGCHSHNTLSSPQNEGLAIATTFSALVCGILASRIAVLLFLCVLCGKHQFPSCVFIVTSLSSKNNNRVASSLPVCDGHRTQGGDAVVMSLSRSVAAHGTAGSHLTSSVRPSVFISVCDTCNHCITHQGSPVMLAACVHCPRHFHTEKE